MEFHPIVELFPMMTDEEMFALRADIKTNGLKEPIWTYEGKIIDGRNRYYACETGGIKPRFREWDGKGSLIQFVVSMNLHRRHLTSSQKAVIALEIEEVLAEEARAKEAKRKKRTSQKIEKSPPIHAAQQAASIVGTNRQYVIDAKEIAQEAPEMIEKIRKGEVNIQDAKRYTRLDKDQREEVQKTITSERVGLKTALKKLSSESRPPSAVVTLQTEITNLYRALLDLEMYKHPDALNRIVEKEKNKDELLKQIRVIQDRLGQMADALVKKKKRKKL